jgi:hypothetical protein
MTDPAAGEPGDPSDAALLQADAEALERDADVVERIAVERAATRWPELLAGSAGRDVSLTCLDGTLLTGTVVDAGSDWCVLAVGGRALLVPLRQVLTAAGLGRAAPRVDTRAGMGWALRRWARMRSDLTVHLVNGSVIRGRVVDVLKDAMTLRVDVPTAITIPFTSVGRVSGDMFSE